MIPPATKWGIKTGDDSEAVDIELKRRQAVKCQRTAGRKFSLVGKFIRKARAEVKRIWPSQKG